MSPYRDEAELYLELSYLVTRIVKKTLHLNINSVDLPTAVKRHCTD